MVPKPDFRLLAGIDVPYGLVNLALSGLDEVGQLFDIPIKVSKAVPPGQVWLVGPLDKDDEPSVRLSNIQMVQDSLTVEAVFKYPLKQIALTLREIKEDE